MCAPAAGDSLERLIPRAILLGTRRGTQCGRTHEGRMHELGIAQGILDIVGRYVPAQRQSAVRTVRVRVGAMAGVVADSLEFCFSAIVRDSPFPEARLAIECIPTRGKCGSCGSDFEIPGAFFLCPGCGGGDVRLVSGRELDVVDIEVAENGDE